MRVPHLEYVALLAKRLRTTLQSEFKKKKLREVVGENIKPQI